MKLSRRTQMILTANLAIVIGETTVMYLLPRMNLASYALLTALDVLMLVILCSVMLHFMLGKAELDLDQANRDLGAKVAELKARAHDGALLREMGELMLTTRSPEETYEIVARYLGRLFPGTRGGFYALRHSRNALEEAGSWGEAHGSERWFAPEECWAFRRGKRHLVLNSEENMSCGHVHLKGLTRYCCVPMVANGESLGLLHIVSDCPPEAGESASASEFKLDLLAFLAERVALGLANNHLQQKLENQSIRDPLTGLLNRRYLEESFEKELHRARRKQEPVGIIMMDLDHFKQVNDEYGHDAGDAALRAVSGPLQKSIREEDIACRLGGEEFLLVLPGMNLEHLRQRAGDLLGMFPELHISHQDRRLRPVTVSLGLACFPAHGADQASLLRAADQALYASKHAGRNRATVASLAARPDSEQVAAG